MKNAFINNVLMLHLNATGITCTLETCNATCVAIKT